MQPMRIPVCKKSRATMNFLSFLFMFFPSLVPRFRGDDSHFGNWRLLLITATFEEKGLRKGGF